MYEQSLVKVVEPVKLTTISRLNKSRAWKYGYDKEHNIVVISKTGQIGEIIEVQSLRIALPPVPKDLKKGEDKWVVEEYPKELKRIKSIFDWQSYPDEFKSKWEGYIDEEFNRRENGHWFYNKGIPTYITGTHYMYLQWSKIDVGHPDYREANRIFFIFWEACKADRRSYGMCYLKNRRSGFSFMASEKPSTWQPYQVTPDLVSYQKQVRMPRRCLPTRSYPSRLTIRFSSNLYRTVWTDQRPNLHIGFQLQSSLENRYNRKKHR